MINKNLQKSGLTYKGEVKVVLKKGKKILNTKTYKNNGLQELFNFFCLCLAGEYTSAEPSRLKYLRCFTVGEEGEAVPQFDSFSELIDKQKTENRSIILPIYTGTPEHDSDNATLTFKFLVPLVQLTKITDINMLALYSYKNIGGTSKSDMKNAGAYIILKKTDNNEDVLDTLISRDEISGDINDYNVIVEWKMSFSNK